MARLTIPNGPSVALNPHNPRRRICSPAGEGIAVIPTFVSPAGRNRSVVMSKFINSVVNVDFSRISLQGKKRPLGTEDLTSFLQSYIARWADQAGIL